MSIYRNKPVPWEDVGSLPPVGQRKWEPDEKPPADWFNWWFDAVEKSFADIETSITTGIPYKIWTSSNDGPGSSLDADTLDGLHATAFTTVDSYTSSDVLAKLLTVDGSGSGLDADLLDGRHADTNPSNHTVAFRDSTGRLAATEFYAGGWQYKVWHDGNAYRGGSTHSYHKLPNGLIIQHTTYTLTSVAAGADVWAGVNYPIAFPNACLAVFATPATSNTVTTSILGPTPLNSTMLNLKNIGSSTINLTCTILAIGY